MGFQWNSNKSSTNFLAASVFEGSKIPTASPITSEDGWTINYGAAPNGPTVIINNFGGALEYIKIGFVYSRFDDALVATTYPYGSTLLYTSSYIFEKVVKFNTTVPIKRGALGSITDYNQHYYRLPDTRYAIYGLTAFSLPKSTTTVCGSQIWVNATLTSINTYNMFTPNLSPTNFYFSADIFTLNLDVLCASTDPSIPTFSDILTVGKKNFFTVPTQSLEQYIVEDPVNFADIGGSNLANVFRPTALPNTIFLQYYAAKNGNNDTILYRAEIPFTGLTVGAPVKFEFGYFDTRNPAQNTVETPVTIGMTENITYNVELKVNGFILFQNNFVAKALGTNIENRKFKGLNINSNTANVVITISYPRSLTVDQNLFTYILVSQYVKAYDPSTGCCVASCPANTGLDVVLTPPTCVSCDVQAGLYYNPNNGTCTCLSGYYLDTSKTFQCYPCAALYCSICIEKTPTQCTTCATGAILNNVTLQCLCGPGFFINGTVCQQCPYACQTCNSPNGACSTCVDSQHRDITQNCKCISGFYDSGSVNCSTCSGTCLTCTNGTACTSCDSSKFRSLNGAVCSCMAGYYEMYNDDQSRTCQKCNPECLTCSISPTSCTSCDPKKNRISGMDDYGHQTCLCQPGYYSTSDGSCIQSNCNADPFCSQCEQGLKLCVQCLASKNRIIQLPESICRCMDGYYEDATKNCVPCTTGCGVCKSATNCTACVALATPNGNGACSCPSRTYFTISPDGVRYCSACGLYCAVCLNSSTCTTCQTSFTKTVDNQCVCSAKNFIDAKGNCVPCASGCQTCTSSSNCTKCIDPLVLQGSVCQANCNDGFTALGSVCLGCPKGCLQCTQNFICFYCADGLYMYNGNCYDICPAGTIGDNTGANWNCVPCNSPCKTCLNHPSYCTSCENGKGYLQTSAVQQSCVEICNDGTFAQNGVCQVCDFKCATCLGSSTNCISCPSGQLLYKGGCWATCPAILLSDTKSGTASSCVETCPDGFYKVSETECSACSAQCTTCNGGPDNCTSCLQGSVSTNGTCTVKCGENQFSFQGICVACSSSCYGCQYTPQNCLACASGYVKSGSICQKGCLSYQFYDASQQKCIACDSSCATCSTFNYCTTCANSAITPRGGVCSSCPYPCSTCDQTGICTGCLSGFYYFQGSCQTTCPSGSSAYNGICRCNSGIVSNGQCVASCASGSTSIAGKCQSCNSNCAECSGNVNSCTKCLTGWTIDANTQKCVSSTQCPYGQEANNGICENICDSGFFYYEGICIYGGCFTGYADNGFGGCARKSGTTTTSSSSVTCSVGQFLLNGACVSSCGNSFYPDSASGKCLTCSANCVSCFNANYCVTCQSGFQNNNGACVASTSCSSTQYQYGSGCVGSCPIGTFVQGSQCQRSCPDSTYYQSQICYINCPSGLRTSDACVATCPAGTTKNNGICA